MSAAKKKRVVKKTKQIKAKREPKKRKKKISKVGSNPIKKSKRSKQTPKKTPKKSRKPRNLRSIKNAPKVKRRKRKLSPAKEKKKRERRKIFQKAMEEDRFEDVRDMLDRTRRDGTEAVYPSAIRHLGENTDRALSRLRRAAGEKGHETAKFREEAEFLAEFFQVSVREVYTLWFSP